jgi:hypothetical protein
MRIQGNGTVGIGTNAPEAGLHVVGSGWFAADSGSLGSGAGKGVRIFMDSASTPNIGRVFAYDYASGGSLDMTIQSNGGGVGIGNITPAYKLQINQDSAAKPSTNTWTVASDLRLKKDIAPFSDGLSVIEKINPIRYRYNGLAGLPNDAEGIGVVAQEIRRVAPYTVGTFKAKLDERAEGETELYDFNSHALTFVMINAIKELDERTKGLAGKDAQAPLTRALAAEPKPFEGQESFQRGEEVPDANTQPSDRTAVLEVSPDVQAGEVVVIVPDNGTALHPCNLPADPMVVGVALADATDGLAPVATSGITFIKADATLFPITKGDLLATSPTPGHAMKAQPVMVTGFPLYQNGTVIGKAMEDLSAGTGLIKVLVMLR